MSGLVSYALVPTDEGGTVKVCRGTASVAEMRSLPLNRREYHLRAHGVVDTVQPCGNQVHLHDPTSGSL